MSGEKNYPWIQNGIMDNHLAQKVGTQMESWFKLFLTEIILRNLQSYPISLLPGPMDFICLIPKVWGMLLEWGGRSPFYLQLIWSFPPCVKYHTCKHFTSRFIWKGETVFRIRDEALVLISPVNVLSQPKEYLYPMCIKNGEERNSI